MVEVLTSDLDGEPRAAALLDFLALGFDSDTDLDLDKLVDGTGAHISDSYSHTTYYTTRHQNTHT